MKPINVIVFGNVGKEGKELPLLMNQVCKDENINASVLFCEDIKQHDKSIHGAIYHFSVEALQKKELQEQVINDIKYFNINYPNTDLCIVWTGVSQDKNFDDSLVTKHDDIKNFFETNKQHLGAFKDCSVSKMLDKKVSIDLLNYWLRNRKLKYQPLQTLFETHVEKYVTDLKDSIENLMDLGSIDIKSLSDLLENLADDLLANPKKTNKIEVLEQFDKECRAILQPMYESQVYKDKVAAEPVYEVILKLLAALLYVIIFPFATLYCTAVGGLAGFGLGVGIGAAVGGPGGFLIGGMIGAVIGAVSGAGAYTIAQVGMLGLIGYATRFAFFKPSETDPLARFSNEALEGGTYPSIMFDYR